MQHIARAINLGTRQAGVVHRSQLRSIGVDWNAEHRLVRAGVLVSAEPGFLAVAGAPSTWEQRCWKTLLGAHGSAVVSRRAAARIHGIGRFAGTEHVDVVELGHRSNDVPGGGSHRSSRLPPDHWTEVRGLPVTTIERTIFDLAALVSLKRYRRGLPALRLGQVARALDDAIGSGLAIERLEALLGEHGGRGRGGTVVLRGLLAERGDGYVVTESDLEDLLVRVLARFGLPAPVRQRNLGGLDDRIGRVDFLYPAARLVIEADGRQNHTALLDRESDAWRDLELTAAGFRVIRVTWRQLTQEPERFVRMLRLLLADAPRAAAS